MTKSHNCFLSEIVQFALYIMLGIILEHVCPISKFFFYGSQQVFLWTFVKSSWPFEFELFLCKLSYHYFRGNRSTSWRIPAAVIPIPQLIQVKQGFEPVPFTGWFMAWDNKYFQVSTYDNGCSEQPVCVCNWVFTDVDINQIWLFMYGDRPLMSPSKEVTQFEPASSAESVCNFHC